MIEPGQNNHQAEGQQDHAHDAAEWAEIMARTVAHLAAQLTMTQLRLRALATVLGADHNVDEARVKAELASAAAADTETYLRENLGEALNDIVDVEALAGEISAYLRS